MITAINLEFLSQDASYRDGKQFESHCGLT